MFRVVPVASCALAAALLMAQQGSKDTLPGMPPVLDAKDIYAADYAGKLSPTVKDYPALVYVPNSVSNTVSVIDQKTFKVIKEFPVGKQPQHVTPSYDLKTLWVLNDLGDSLTKIDPRTAEKKETISIKDPYNMYYTPDGKYAIVVAEREKRLYFRDAQTMELKEVVSTPTCPGIDHMDFTANGRYLIASCEFAGRVVKVDVAERKVVGTLSLYDHDMLMLPEMMLHHGMGGGRRSKHNPKKPTITKEGMPQDVKTSPDGKTFYVADMMSDGVYMVDPDTFKQIGFLATGKGAHGLYASRDSKVLYVSNRGEGSVTIVDFATRKIINKWKIPNGGSPDMGGVSADGKALWLSGRRDGEVYVFDTGDGHLLARIKVGKGPHGLCVYPQPGRYSLGHTGVFR